MEVIDAGLRQTPEMIVNAALQEDVQVIGLNILSGAHNAFVPRVMGLLKEKELDDLLVVAGGIITDDDAANLKKLGAAAVFQPGAALEVVVAFAKSAARVAEWTMGHGAETVPSNILLGFCYTTCKTD
jgi:methylmalonyl-CoA mutase C-terminal domain/subunit